MQELIELRKANMKVFDLGNGKRQAIIQQGLHYFDRDTNKYEDYRPLVEDDPFPTGFAKRFKGRHWSRFGVGGRWRFGFAPKEALTYVPVNAASVSPVVSGSQVAYINLWSDVDLNLEVFPEAIKESIILHAPGLSSLSFNLERFGVTLRQAGTALEVLDVDGNIVGRVQTPTVHDATGSEGTVTMTLEGDVLTLALDEAWLASAVYPVVVDPTTVVIQPSSKDAYINEYYTTDNYGSATELYLGCYEMGASSEMRATRSLLAFDLSSIPSGITVTNALLKIYVTYSSTEGPGYIYIRRIDADWDEASVTWNTAPSATTISTVDSGITGTGWKSLSIPTDTVQAWVDGTIPNYGLLLRRTDERPAATAYCGFASREYSTSDYRPIFEVTYQLNPTVSITTPDGSESTPDTINDDITPNLEGVYNSTEPADMAYRQHQVYDADGNLVWDSGKTAASATPGSTVSVPVPSGYLKYGQKYRWRWMAWDTNGNASPWSTAGWFVCVLTAPTGLSATADLANAEIDLSWTAHTGETLAGYNIYRRKTGAENWSKINVEGLVTGTGYTDEAVGSGVSYDYKVTAVASDGYESDYSAAVTQSVTFDGAWLGSQEVHLLRWPVISTPRRVSRRQTVQGKWKVQDFGNAARELRLRIRFLTLADRDAVMSIFDSASAILAYRDSNGDAFKGYLVTDLTPEYLSLGATVGYIDVMLAEAV